MFDIQHYTSFVLAILIFQLVPGAGTIAILRATAMHGYKTGLSAVAGTLLGDSIYMLAAVAGLGALLGQHPRLFLALQWFGAAYLCWLGMQLLWQKIHDTDAADNLPVKHWQVFRQACGVSLTNPKVILFFVSFFPLFIRADAAPLTLGIMMLHVTLISLLYQVLLVFLGNWVALRLKRLTSARKIATRLAGIALLGFGLKLAASHR